MMKNKKLVLDFWPVKNPPELDGMYFVLFQIIGTKKIEYHFGYAEFNLNAGWIVPDPTCIVNQWCSLPSTKLLLG